MFLIRLVILPVRLAFGSLALGYRFGSLLGYRRLLTFGTGVAVGLLLAPVPGEALRRRLAEVLPSGGGPQAPEALADRVRAELSQSPRTWHLPQPRVETAGNRVVLHGEVPHAEGRTDIERTVAAVPGVAVVDNQVVVSPPASGNGAGTSTGDLDLRG
jgi:hypothetical protein